MKRLAILGAGGHGKVVADTAECCGWKSVEFFDDGWPSRTQSGQWMITGNTESLMRGFARFDGVVVAIGDNSVRLTKQRELQSAGVKITTLIHPASTVSRYAKIGDGSVIFAGAIVNVDAVIGLGAIINTGSSVDHDCLLGDSVHISPGACLAGGVRVGDRAWIGMGSSVLPNVVIGSGVIVGAGAVVIKNIQDNAVVAGVPAVSIRK